jgi:ABC-type nitrate/sulfonate/bicarbonate transport system ATPase subunit
MREPPYQAEYSDATYVSFQISESLERGDSSALAMACADSASHAAADAGHPVGMLSGREAQKTSLARGIVLDPELLFLDEPFAAPNQPTRRRFVKEVC